jgi:uncharacterized protein (TIGR00251 family)
MRLLGHFIPRSNTLRNVFVLDISLNPRTLESFLGRPSVKETLVKVYLQPKSSKNEVVGPYRDGIKVKVTAPPVEGKANESLIRFLARECRISPSSIEMIKGHHAREKILKIAGNIDQELLKRILAK